MKAEIVNIGRDYYKIPRCSHSELQNIDKSALFCRHQKLNPRETSEKMALGSYVHALVLQPHMIEEDFAISEKVDRRTKAGKEAMEAFETANAGKIIINPEQEETGRKIADAILRHKKARQILDKVTFTEVSIMFDRSGVACKARLDAVSDTGLIIDLKTTDDATHKAFASSVANYNYHTQAEFYLHAAVLAGLVEDAEFIFIAAENKAPFDVACYVMSHEDLEYAFGINEWRLEKYRQCLETNDWPGISEHLIELRLPKWARIEN